MNKNNWILVDSDFDSEDWHFDYFPEVGIISRSYCNDIFLFARFNEYPYTDCPRCKKLGKNYEIENNNSPKFRYKCKNCRHIFSTTSGTYLDKSKLESIYWYRLAFLIIDLKFPINSHALSKSLGLTQKTVYYMLITIKKAMNFKSNGIVDGINFSLPNDLSWWHVIRNLLKIDCGLH